MRERRKLECLVASIKMAAASAWFWRVNIVLLSLQSIYIATVGRYSMAFDEYYHFQVIQAYAKTWFPWQIKQPSGPASLGAITADPSYLYHYLLSWLYRVMALVTANQTTQIIIIRLIDVGFVVVGFYVFRRLLLRLGMSRAAAHVVLAFVMWLPVTPLLAGQVTYDTLFFLATAVALYAIVDLSETISLQHRLPLTKVLLVLTAMLWASQVKYAFLPAALIGGVFILVQVVRGFRKKTLSFQRNAHEWSVAIKKPIGLILVVVLIISASFFGIRYGDNLVRYHSPVPTCDTVLSHDACLAFGPFARDDNHKTLKLKAQLTKKDRLIYPLGWFGQMVEETYFAVGPLQAGYPTATPLPVAFVAGYILAIGCFICLIIRSHALWRIGNNERLLLCLVVGYIFMLFITNYQAYTSTGVAVAIHGRYLLPFIPIIGFLFYRALKTMRMLPNRRSWAVVVASVLLMATIYGGGALPLIVRSDDNWFWPSAAGVTQLVRHVVKPLVIS